MTEAIVLVCDIGFTLDAQSLSQLKQVSVAFLLRCITYGSYRQLLGIVAYVVYFIANSAHTYFVEVWFLWVLVNLKITFTNL